MAVSDSTLLVCTKCGQPKPTDQFGVDTSRSRGFNGQCKDCRREYVRERGRLFYARNRERERLRVRTKAQKLRSNGRPFEPLERARARGKVNLAIRRGKLVKPTTCSRCGEGGKINAQHHDYSKPFDVRWLCTICHGLEHRKS